MRRFADFLVTLAAVLVGLVVWYSLREMGLPTVGLAMNPPTASSWRCSLAILALIAVGVIA